MSDILDLTEEQMDSVPELKLAESGEEYQIKIISVNKDKDKNDIGYIMPFFEVADDPLIEEFSDFLGLPDPENSDKQNNKRKDRLNKFAACFGVDWSRPVEVEDLKGLTGWAILGRTKGDDEYGPQNKIKKYIAPRE